MKIVLIFLILSITCKKRNDPPPAPGKATLVFPENNSACTTGANITDSTSSITFTWNASTNTTSYELTVRNLLTRVTTTRVITTNMAKDTLLRKTPYSWTVKSISSASTTVTQSDTSKFYMSAPGESNYSPFPAALTAPKFNQLIPAPFINLAWKGKDVDNDITGYDVYFGTAVTPPLYKSTSDMYMQSVAITAGTTYYWRVVTHDIQGNTATSDLYQFMAY